MKPVKLEDIVAGMDMQSDEFERPAGFSIELDCDKAKRESSRRGGYVRERY